MLDAGYKVTVVDNLMFDQTSLNHVCHDENFDFLELMSAYDEDGPIIFASGYNYSACSLCWCPLCKKDPIGAHTINNEAIKNDADKFIEGPISFNAKLTNSAYGSGDENNFCDEIL